ncbi:MAG: hypothetical protein HYS62_00245 [Candidatus Aenigmarchaeota archaeon]|nr:hypothetical protein [Candidatus Aenigmarchaeota archaeon]
MASRTRSSSSSKRSARKGQFFILTTVAIVTTLFFVGRWIGPSSQVDTSSQVLSDELFTFENIKEKAIVAVENSESCEDLKYNIQEYKNFIDAFARDKNYQITFTYAISPSCEELGSAVAEFALRIISERTEARGIFSVTWP